MFRHGSRSRWRSSIYWFSGMASSLMRLGSCPSRWLSLVCKILMAFLGLSETNTIGYYPLSERIALYGARNQLSRLCRHPLSLPTCKRGLEHTDQFLGRVRRQLNGDARTEALGGVREIDVDGVLQRRMQRMVKRHADKTQVEPTLGAFAPAGNLRCFHDVGAHRCVLLSFGSQAY